MRFSEKNQAEIEILCIDSAMRRALILPSLLPIFSLIGCQSLAPQGSLSKAETRARAELGASTIVGAEHLLARAKSMPEGSEMAAVYRLRAAEIAWEELRKNGRGEADVDPSQIKSENHRALTVLNHSQDGLAPLFLNGAPQTQTFSHAGQTFTLRIGTASQPGHHLPAEFSKLKPAREVDTKLCQKLITDAGLGEPFAAHWNEPTDPRLQKFVSRRGYLQSITSVLEFSKPMPSATSRTVTMCFLDPTAISKVKLADKTYPLAANYTAAIVEPTRDIKEFSLGLWGLFRPSNDEANLMMLEPYDSKRIPIVMVHGLLSHPRMWRDNLNELRADPELKGKYQFWSFYYPTGWPISYSAMRLREEMEKLHHVLGRHPGMILMGHSMGGILSRLQSISPGMDLWNATLEDSAVSQMKRLPANSPLKRSLLFSANPEVRRLIFICVPHQGTPYAKWSLVRSIAKLIKLPANILQAMTDIPGTVEKTIRITSLDRLAPDNPLYTVMKRTPIKAPFHSIIGDRGKGNTPNSSDGAVEYWSSHVEGAQSELIVPYGHGAYNQPKTMEELKRILKLHLKNP